MNHPDWLLYCRPGFERDCIEETRALPCPDSSGSGYVAVRGKPRLSYAQLVFARQLIRLHGSAIPLPERDRLTPLLEAISAMPGQFGALHLETPDTNEGKTLSGFTRRFQPLLETALREAGRLTANAALPRLHLFFPDRQRAFVGVSEPDNSSAAHMGILRLKIPRDAPSRSWLKLAEAFEFFLNAGERQKWLKPGMHAVDLGAAPGGWSWQLAQRGIKVTAVDNGPLKGIAAEHPAIRHLRQDGFRYRPARPVDWVMCDMVEQPQRVAALMADWIASGHSARAMFNLKLPMKKRLPALESALGAIRETLEQKKIRYSIRAKQLYHDRDEVTVFLARGGGGKLGRA